MRSTLGEWIERLALVAISALLGGGGAELHHGNNDDSMQAQIRELQRDVNRLEDRVYTRPQ